MPGSNRFKTLLRLSTQVTVTLRIMLCCYVAGAAHAQVNGGINVSDSGKATPTATTQAGPLTPVTKADLSPATTQSLPAVKATVPSATAHRAASDRVKDVFGLKIEAAKQTTDKLEVAKKLLQAGIDEQADLDNRFVLLTLATDEASSAGSFEIASQAIDELTKSHQVDTLKLKADAATSVAKVIRSPQDRVQLVAATVALVDQAVGQDRYELAIQIVNVGLATARLSDDPVTIRRTSAQVARVREIQSAYVEIKPAIETLAHKPTDADAALKVGKFLCLVKGDWQRGLPLLAIGSPSDLAKLAGKELADPNSAKDQTSLADGWWDQADKLPVRQKQLVRQHAASWYRQAFPSVVKGLLREKLEQRIELCSAADDSTAAHAGAVKQTSHFDWKGENLPKYEGLKVVTSWRRTPPKISLAGQVVNGSLVLTQGKSPYLITGPIVVSSGSTLTIEPGAILLFAPKVKMQIEGNLTAVSDGPWIVFAAADGDSNWSGITSSGKIDFRRCLMTGADDVLEADQGNVAVAGCIFADDVNTLGFGNNGHGKLQDSLFLHNSRGPVGHGDYGSVDFTRCLFLFNKVGCTANFNGKTKGNTSTFYGNDTAIEGADRGDFLRVTLSNIITTSGKPLSSRGGKAVVSGNYWGSSVPVDAAHDISGPLAAPVKEAFPNLPPCEYLTLDGSGGAPGEKPPVATK